MTRSRSIQSGRTRLVLLFLALLGLAMTVSTGPASAAAQGADYDFTNYMYYADDGSTGLYLAHIQPYDRWAAAELVSPRYAEDILQSIAILDEYWWADNLDRYYINQIEGADEYMVFEGELNFYDGWRSGYVMLLSVDQEVFLLAGYRADIDDLFELAEETIYRESAPRSFNQYTRVNIDEEGVEPSNNGNNDSATVYVVCYEDPDYANFDLNGDGLVLIEELMEFRSSQGVLDVIDLLIDEGYDGIQYVNC